MTRLVEADLVRTIAILLVIATHLPDYIALPGLQPYTVYTTLFGNGLFLFLSGYLIHASTKARPSSSLHQFMGRRLQRIMPLYWIALAVFVLLIVRPDAVTLALHAAGLQIALAPALVTPLPTLWFVGLILMLYPIYHLAVSPASGPRSMLLAAVVALLPFIAARVFLDAPEVRFFLYYFVFMAGAAASESSLLDRVRTRGVALISLSAAASLAAFVLMGSPVIGEAGAEGLDILVLLIVANWMIISWALLAWTAARAAGHSLGPRTVQALAICSSASYFVYLFHRPVLLLTASALICAGATVPLQLLAVVAVALPALFWAGHRVQKLVDQMAGRAIERLHGKARDEEGR